MSKRLGIGVMLSFLGGNAETVRAICLAKGCVIRDIRFLKDSRPEKLVFTFDNFKVALYDDGGTCIQTTTCLVSSVLGFLMQSCVMDQMLKASMVICTRFNFS